jgi:hypothetical protein
MQTHTHAHEKTRLGHLEAIDNLRLRLEKANDEMRMHTAASEQNQKEHSELRAKLELLNKKSESDALEYAKGLSDLEVRIRNVQSLLDASELENARVGGLLETGDASLAISRSSLVALNIKVDELTRVLAEKELDVSTLKNDMTRTTIKLGELHELHARVVGIDKTEREKHEALESRVGNVTKKLQRQNTKMSDLNAEIRQVNGTLESKNAEIARLEQAAKGSRADAEQDKASLSQQNEKLAAELAINTNALHETIAINNDLQTRILSADNRADALEAKHKRTEVEHAAAFEKYTREMATLTETLLVLDKTIDERINNASAAAKRTIGLVSENKLLRSAIDESKTTKMQIRDLDRKHRTVEIEYKESMGSLQATVAAEQAKNANLQTELTGLLAPLEDAFVATSSYAPMVRISRAMTTLAAIQSSLGVNCKRGDTLDHCVKAIIEDSEASKVELEKIQRESVATNALSSALLGKLTDGLVCAKGERLTDCAMRHIEMSKDIIGHVNKAGWNDDVLSVGPEVTLLVKRAIEQNGMVDDLQLDNRKLKNANATIKLERGKMSDQLDANATHIAKLSIESDAHKKTKDENEALRAISVGHAAKVRGMENSAREAADKLQMLSRVGDQLAEARNSLLNKERVALEAAEVHLAAKSELDLLSLNVASQNESIARLVTDRRSTQATNAAMQVEFNAAQDASNAALSDCKQALGSVSSDLAIANSAAQDASVKYDAAAAALLAHKQEISDASSANERLKEANDKMQVEFNAARDAIGKYQAELLACNQELEGAKRGVAEASRAARDAIQMHDTNLLAYDEAFNDAHLKNSGCNDANGNLRTDMDKLEEQLRVSAIELLKERARAAESAVYATKCMLSKNALELGPVIWRVVADRVQRAGDELAAEDPPKPAAVKARKKAVKAGEKAVKAVVNPNMLVAFKHWVAPLLSRYRDARLISDSTPRSVMENAPGSALIKEYTKQAAVIMKTIQNEHQNNSLANDHRIATLLSDIGSHLTGIGIDKGVVDDHMSRMTTDVGSYITSEIIKLFDDSPPVSLVIKACSEAAKKFNELHENIKSNMDEQVARINEQVARTVHNEDNEDNEDNEKLPAEPAPMPKPLTEQERAGHLGWARHWLLRFVDNRMYLSPKFRILILQCLLLMTRVLVDPDDQLQLDGVSSAKSIWSSKLAELDSERANTHRIHGETIKPPSQIAWTTATRQVEYNREVTLEDEQPRHRLVPSDVAKESDASFDAIVSSIRTAALHPHDATDRVKLQIGMIDWLESEARDASMLETAEVDTPVYRIFNQFIEEMESLITRSDAAVLSTTRSMSPVPTGRKPVSAYGSYV